MREEVLNKAHEMFIQYGIKSITMDDIARELSISKKTLYESVKDKNELVDAVSSIHLKKEKEDFTNATNNSVNAIDELVKISQCMRRNLRDINPTLLFDLKKYHSKAWSRWGEFKLNFIIEQVKRNLERGIKEGLFRPNINVGILATMRMHQVEMAFDPKIYARNEYDFREVQIEIFNHFVYGIVTEKGRILYEQYINESIEK